MKILLVDDDKGLCNMTKSLLGKNGYEVVAFYDAESGLDYALKNKCDFILMDIMLPGISGPEAVQAIKASPDYKGVPVLFLTSLVSGQEEGLQGINVHGVEYQTLGKPYHIDNLLALIKSYE
jgi:DNA-binding response OmpR family regulator